MVFNMKKIIIVIIFLLSLTACEIKKDEVKEQENKEEINYSEMTNDEFLSNISEFEKEGNSDVVWTFNSDGTGKITNDGGISYFDMKWSLYNDKLLIVINWVYDNNSDYRIVIDKENNSFILNDEIKFVKYNNLSLLKGAWSSKTDKGEYMWYFDPNLCYVGYYNEKFYVSNRYSWNIVDDKIELILGTDVVEKYDYSLDNEMLVISDDEKAVAIAGVMGAQNSEIEIKRFYTLFFRHLLFFCKHFLIFTYYSQNIYLFFTNPLYY